VICDAYLYLKFDNKKSAIKFLGFMKANYEKNPSFGAFHKPPTKLLVEKDVWACFVINNVLVAYPIVKYLVKIIWFISLIVSFKWQHRLSGSISFLGSGDVAKYYVDGRTGVFR